MKKIITSIFAVATVAALVSCSEGSAGGEGLESVAPADGVCNISVAPTVGNATVSKADISFGDKDDDITDPTIGLAIYKTNKENAIHSYPDVYNNIKATYDSNKWMYRFSSMDMDDESLPQISLFTTEGACKVYGYYPYLASVSESGIEYIKFKASDNYQFMYAESDVTEILGVDQKKIDLKFKQAMTRLRFHVELKNYTSAVEFYHFILETQAEDKLVSEATFNAKTGEITDRIYVKKMQTKSQTNGIGINGVDRDVYLTPFTLTNSDEDDIKVFMRYEELDSPSYFVINEGNFDKGVSHTINVTLDNFGKVIASSIEVDKKWNPGTIGSVDL